MRLRQLLVSSFFLSALIGVGVAGCSSSSVRTEGDDGTSGAPAGGTVGGSDGGAGGGDGGSTDGGGPAGGSSTGGSSTGGSSTGGGDDGGTSAGGASPGGAGAAGVAGSPSGGDGAGNECGTGTTCVPPAPADWVGPVTTATSDLPTTAAACDGSSYPSELAVGNRDLQTDTYTCSCSCTTNRACNVVGTASGIITSECGSGDEEVSVEYDVSCNNTTSLNGVTNPPEYQEEIRVCGAGAGLDRCEGSGRCAPVPTIPFSKVCVYRAGEHACPAGDFSEQEFIYSGFGSPGACPACECEIPNPGYCQIRITDCNVGGVDDYIRRSDDPPLSSDSGNQTFGPENGAVPSNFGGQCLRTASSPATPVVDPPAPTIAGTLCCLP